MLVAQCLWVFNEAYLVVYQMFWPIYIRPYFALCTWIRCCHLFTPFSSSLFSLFFFFGVWICQLPEILSLALVRGLCLRWPVTIEAGPSCLTYVL